MQNRSPSSLAVTQYERKSKKAIGILESIFLSLGFTTSHLVHFITPIAQGGLGLTIGNLGLIISTLIFTGISTIAIAIVITIFLFQVMKQDEKESKELVIKERHIKEKQTELFARLIYLRYLSDQAEQVKKLDEKRLDEKKQFFFKQRSFFELKMQKKIESTFRFDKKISAKLAHQLETFYHQERSGILKAIKASSDQRKKISEETAIKNYLWDNEVRCTPFIKEAFTEFASFDLTSPNHWKPNVIGFFAGFVSFMSVSSGFLGMYSSVLTLAAIFTSVNLALPVLGWVVLSVSLVFALCVGLVVRHITDARIKREAIMLMKQTEDSRLSDALEKVHAPEIAVLNFLETKKIEVVIQKEKETKEQLDYLTQKVELLQKKVHDMKEWGESAEQRAILAEKRSKLYEKKAEDLQKQKEIAEKAWNLCVPARASRELSPAPATTPGGWFHFFHPPATDSLPPTAAVQNTHRII